MPAPKHRDVQTDKTDGDQFITIPVGSNGRLAYRKVYLRTRDRVVARRRARARADQPVRHEVPDVPPALVG